MIKLNIFTKKDLVVSLLCIVFLLANIAAVSQTGRKRAQEIACRSILLKWGQVYSAYTADNDGYFHRRGGVGGIQIYFQLWPYVYKPYYGDAKMRFCPSAADVNCVGGPFGIWNCDAYGDWDPYRPELWVPGENAPCLGSYGENRFIVNMLGSFSNNPAFWRRAGYKNSAQVPILTDAMYFALWGFEDAIPPEYDGDLTGGYTQQCACIIRHMMVVNVLFMDWSVRSVGLKELWTLKWSRTYDTCGEWTICGNGGSQAACAAKWDEAAPWMKNFPEY